MRIKTKFTLALLVVSILPLIVVTYILQNSGFLAHPVIDKTLAVAFVLAIVLAVVGSTLFAEWIVLKQIRDIRRFCSKIHNRNYNTYFDLSEEKEEENELVSLKREMNWMADLIKRRDEELRKALEKLQETSITDPLTGLFNRRYFSYRLEEEISRFNRMQEVLCLLLIDIDNFKQINDQCGHQQGDMVLSEIGRILKERVRFHDICSRIGGDEFGILLPLTHYKQAIAVAKHLQENIIQIKVCVEQDKKIIPVTVSIGLACLEAGCSCPDTDTLYGWADLALYEAKNAGRNNIRVYDCLKGSVLNHLDTE